MTDISRLVATPSAEDLPAQAQGHRGKFASSPSSASVAAEVTLDEFAEPGAPPPRFGPLEWMPRGETLPKRNDPCVVIFADDGEGYVTWWKPKEPA